MDVNPNAEISLPQFLRQARVNHELKRSKIAETLKMNIESVRLWETGKNGIPIEKVAQVAKAYNLTDEEKRELEGLALNQSKNIKTTCDTSEEVKLLGQLLTLPKDVRQRIVRAIVAYDSSSEEK